MRYGQAFLRTTEKWSATGLISWMGQEVDFFAPSVPIIRKERMNMKYTCELCGYVYDEVVGDPKRGIPPGTAFKDLPEYFECPGCGCEKEAFDPVRPRQSLQTHSHSRKVIRK